jgi:hypothetical protein
MFKGIARMAKMIGNTAENKGEIDWKCIVDVFLWKFLGPNWKAWLDFLRDPGFYFGKLLHLKCLDLDLLKSLITLSSWDPKNTHTFSLYLFFVLTRYFDWFFDAKNKKMQ